MRLYRSFAAIGLVAVLAACAGQSGYNDPDTLAAYVLNSFAKGDPTCTATGKLQVTCRSGASFSPHNYWAKCIASGEHRMTCSVAQYMSTYLVSEDGTTVIRES